MKNKSIYIYALVDPVIPNKKYIGKTCNLFRRFQEHLSCKDKSHTRRDNWIKKLLHDNLKPDVIILEIFYDVNLWQQKERQWIKFFREKREIVLNHTDGGDGVHNPDEQSRKRLSQTRKKMFQNPEFRKKFDKWVKSPERCSKISQKMTGKKKAKEHVAKLPQNQKGWKHTAETIEKIRIASVGRKCSETTKEKLRKINIGNNWGLGNKSRTGQHQSDEEKLKKSLKLRGRKFSPETIKRMSEARSAFWKNKKEKQNGKKLSENERVEKQKANDTTD